MPTLERIRQFEKALVSVGAEREILAEHGEEVEEVSPPGEPIPADLQDLLAPPEPAAGVEPPAETSPLEASPPPPEPAEAELVGDELLDALDLGDLGLGEETPAEGEGAGAPPRETPPAEGAAEPVGEPEEAFELPAGLAEALEAGEPEAVEAQEPVGSEAPVEAAAPSEDAGRGEAGGPAEAEVEEFTLPEGLFETGGEAAGEADAAASSEMFELPEEAPGAFDEASSEPGGQEKPAEVSEEPFSLPSEGAGEAPFDLPDLPDVPLEAGEPELPAGLPEELAPPEGGEPETAAAESADQFAAPEAGAGEPAGAPEEISFDENEAEPSLDEMTEPLEPAEPVEPPEAAEPEAAPAPLAEAEAGQPEREEDFVLDEFALPGVEEAPAEEEQPVPPPEAAEAPPTGRGPRVRGRKAGEARSEYSDPEFAAIRRALADLPLNLRAAVEEQIGNRTITGEALRHILDLLIGGATASEIARALAQATGIRISLPRYLEKGTGVEFERERASLGYLLRKAVVPALQVLIPVAGLIVGLAFAANEAIIKPLQSQRDYRAAIGQIEAAQYDVAAHTFNVATRRHAIPRWFYRTADAYRKKEQYDRAGDIYERLIGSRTLLGVETNLAETADRRRDEEDRRKARLRRYERDAVLAYANMRTYETFEYGKAEALLNTYFEATGKRGDYRALLALGDNYIEWGSEVPGKYTDAEIAYRKAMREQRPATDEPIMRMLRYYARTGKVDDVEKLVRGFESKPRSRIDPQIYSEAAGALIDAGRYAVARRALGRAHDTDAGVPETMYQFARLFRWLDNPADEEQALRNTLEAAKGRSALSRRLREQAILARTALGELYYRRDEPVKAQAQYAEAIKTLEDDLAARRLKPDPKLGRVYADSADVHYYFDRDLNSALALYQKARDQGMKDDGLSYKMGYIHYDRAVSQPGQGRAADAEGDTSAAALEFHQVVEDERENPSALFAMANTLYLRGDYLAAQGYYNILLRQLESRRQRIPLLQPQENAQHHDLVDLSMRAFNNLGVTEKRIAEDSRAPGREARANYYLQRSIEFYDLLTRAPVTLVRSEARNLGFINSRALMYPQSGVPLQIYREIPLDLESTRF